MEVSGYLVGSAAFKAVGTSEPRPAGSIPVHLRHNQFDVARSMSFKSTPTVLGRKPYVLRLETDLRRGSYREGAVPKTCGYLDSEKVAGASVARWVAQLTHSARLNLTDALTREVESFADFFKCA